MVGARDTCCNGVCSCCPYGCTFVAPCIFGILAISFSWSAAWGCHYVELSNARGNELGVGPWAVETITSFTDDSFQTKDHEECTTWEDHDLFSTSMIDTPLRFTRAISMIGAFLGLFFWIPLMFAGCMILRPSLLSAMIPIFVLVGICMILTLVMLASDVCKDAYDCDLGGGGVVAILAFICWIVTAIVVRCMREKDGYDEDIAPPAGAPVNNSPAEQPQGDTTTIQHIGEEDGTTVKIVTKTSRDANGNQIVTETREVIRPPAKNDVPLTRAVPE
ncbi:hypothetical protein ACA910_008716 [Epithemia clementina (nom. ined.)]